ELPGSACAYLNYKEQCNQSPELATYPVTTGPLLPIELPGSACAYLNYKEQCNQSPELATYPVTTGPLLPIELPGSACFTKEYILFKAFTTITLSV
ncbi:MAG: hypothetical protein KBB67_12705, partial [Syntrophorhabdus sp.]|nr:hypothetical protein [Syntrophorhabdus sp.]